MERSSIRLDALDACRQGRDVAMYDARSVANCIIELSLEYDQKLTHLSLHKILYFIHGKHLLERDEPLVGGHFEAWQYGPVHPLIFSSFKATRGARIVEKAKQTNLLSGEQSDVPEITDKATRLFIRVNAAKFLQLPAGRLVDLSHAPGSPWDILTKRSQSARVYGDRITNDVIRKFYHRHIVSVRDEPLCGEPLDEQPPA